MRLTPGIQLMNLPPYIQFGCELEVENVDSNKVREEIQLNNLNKWKVKKDGSLVDDGAEIVSPPLSESKNPNIYNDFQKICNIINSNPKDKMRSVYADHTCGGHIHLDASVLLNNPKMMENFLRLWAESEPIFYKICNDKNDPIRASAIKFSPVKNIQDLFFAIPTEIIKHTGKIIRDNQSENKRPCLDVKKTIRGYAKATKRGFAKSYTAFNGLAARAVGLVPTTKGYAYPNSRALQKVAKSRDIVKKIKKPITAHYNKVEIADSIRPSQNLKRLMKLHSSGINLENISYNTSLLHRISSRLEGKKEKNTYENRMHNGSTDFNVWKQNIFLDASFLKTVYEMTYEPEKVDKKLSSFYQKDISEEEKLDRFLDLTMDYPEDRKVYKERWESVKDAPVFGKTFQKNCAVTFKRDDIEKIAKTVSIDSISKTMKDVFDKATKFIKGIVNDERGSIILDNNER